MVNYYLFDKMKEINFGDFVIPHPIKIEDLGGWSIDIKDINLSPWETTIFLSIASLWDKVSIKNTWFTIIKNRKFSIFVNFWHARISHLYLEGIEFKLLYESDLNTQKIKQESKIILNEYKWDPNSYWLFYILKQWGLLKWLKEIHIKQNNIFFSEDLFKMIANYWAENNIPNRPKIFCYDIVYETEEEVNDEYFERVKEESEKMDKIFEEIGMKKRVSIVYV